MELEIFWSQLAEDKLKDIFDYYKVKAGLKIARKIVNQIIDKTIDLDQNPNIGQIEDLLNHKKFEFRYLISTNYKIIYYINLVCSVKPGLNVFYKVDILIGKITKIFNKGGMEHENKSSSFIWKKRFTSRRI